MKKCDFKFPGLWEENCFLSQHFAGYSAMKWDKEITWIMGNEKQNRFENLLIRVLITTILPHWLWEVISYPHLAGKPDCCSDCSDTKMQTLSDEGLSSDEENCIVRVNTCIHSVGYGYCFILALRVIKQYFLISVQTNALLQWSLKNILY